MFKFTIRELLILTVTAGLAVGWWLDRSSRHMRERTLRIQYEMARVEKDVVIDKLERELEIADANASRYGKLARAFEMKLNRLQAADSPRQ